jgi:hypothetical protein
LKSRVDSESKKMPWRNGEPEQNKIIRAMIFLTIGRPKEMKLTDFTSIPLSISKTLRFYNVIRNKNYINVIGLGKSGKYQIGKNHTCKNLIPKFLF